MKYLLLLLLTISTTASAQLKFDHTVVGRVKLPSGLKAQLTYKRYHLDTTYFFTFKDMVYKKTDVFKTIQLKGKKEVDVLYEVLLGALNSKPKKQAIPQYVGTNEIYVGKVKAARTTFVKITSDNAWTRLTEEELREVFGK